MNSSNFNAFLVGAALGVVVSTVFTPRSGRENRGLMLNKVKEGEKALRDKTNELKDQVERKGQQISEALDAGRKAYQRGSQRPDALAQSS